MNKLLTISLAIIPVAVLLTGCSTANNDVSKEPTVKEAAFKITNVAEKDMRVTFEQYNSNVAEVQNGKILYTTSGSSSCPPLVEKVSQDNKEYTLHIKQYGKVACTADLAIFQQLIEKTDGEKIPQNAQLVIEHS